MYGRSNMGQAEPISSKLDLQQVNSRIPHCVFSPPWFSSRCIWDIPCSEYMFGYASHCVDVGPYWYNFAICLLTQIFGSIVLYRMNYSFSHYFLVNVVAASGYRIVAIIVEQSPMQAAYGDNTDITVFPHQSNTFVSKCSNSSILLPSGAKYTPSPFFQFVVHALLFCVLEVGSPVQIWKLVNLWLKYISIYQHDPIEIRVSTTSIFMVLVLLL